MAALTTVRLEIPSEIRLIELVHATAETVAGLAGFDEDESLNVALAVREAVINAICHGNREDPELKVSVTLATDERQLVATVRDAGTGFDPRMTPDPTQGENRLRESGRGLLLMHAFVDRVKYRKRTTGGTEVTLIKRLPLGGPEQVSGRDRQ